MYTVLLKQVKLISERKELALREFSFVFISNILNAYKDTSRTICKQKSAVSTFIAFLEVVLNYVIMFSVAFQLTLSVKTLSTYNFLMNLVLITFVT